MPDKTRRATALAFLTAFVTLFAQVLVHRMVSAKLQNNYAFLVISLTMLGFAGSGALLTRRREQWRARADEIHFLGAAFFGLTLIGASVAFYHAPDFTELVSESDPRTQFLIRLVRCLPLALLYALPFAFSGVILGSLLSDPELPSRRIYSFDLVGSALGAFGVIPAITYLGVERSAVAAGALLLTGGGLLAPPRRFLHRALGAASALVLLAAAFLPGRAFTMRYGAASILGLTERPGSGHVLEHVVWDPVARVEVSTMKPPTSTEGMLWPSLVGPNPQFLTHFKRIFTQNNNAFTYAIEYDGHPETLRGIDETIYAAAYQAGTVPHPRALVIGVGGGFDVMTALYFGAAEITGVEVNRAMLGLPRGRYRDYFGAWAEDPRVHLVHDEGRHFLSASPERYDVLQLSGVDSASGTPAAAHVFSENYLYTAEALDLYLSRLSPDGIMNMMRLEYEPPREMLRALVTAVAALRRSGAEEPSRHIVMVAARNGLFAAMLVKKSPFRNDEVARLQRWADASPFFTVAAAPGLDVQPDNYYQAFLRLRDAKREQVFTHHYPFDIRPVTDDRPFFFKYSYWSHLFPKVPTVATSVPVMEYSFLVLLGLTTAAAFAFIYLPLHGLVRVTTDRMAARFGLYFAGIGLGYLGLEMALLQKLGLFLGHPNYALSVVLAALLFATGLGSLLSHQLLVQMRHLRFIGYALALTVLAEHFLLSGPLASLVTLPLAARVLVVSLLLLPVGMALGVYFPTGLERLKAVRPELAPWAWGLNGIFSVIAPILAVGISITWGITLLLVSSLLLYLAVGWIMPPADAA
jgi:spermidine synthase